MGSKNYSETARQIVESFGGKGNISGLNHCATRLRINPSDKSKVDLKGLEKIDGVLGVADNGSEIQVIIGQSVEQLYPAVESLVGNVARISQEKKKKTPGEVASGFLLMMAGIMSPIIPALTTAGFICVLLTLLNLCGIIQTTDTTYIILNGFAQSAFYFLPIYVAYTSARKFETEPVLAMLLAAALLYPDWTSLVSTLTGEGDVFASYFGIPVYLMTYNGGVIQIVLSVWVMSKIDHWLSRVIPEVVRYFLKPFLLILIMSVITLALTGPLGGFATNAIAAGITWLNENIPWLAVPAIILFSVTLGQLVAGFHLALVPLATQSIQTVGYDTVVTIWFFCFTLSAGFISLAVAIKARNSKCRQIAWPAALSGIIGGISEPTVYGIAYKMVTPFYALAITSVVAGLVAGILGLKSYGYGSQSIPGMLLFLGTNGDVTNFRNAIIVLAVIIVLSFVLVYAFGFDDSVYGDVDNEDDASDANAIKLSENLSFVLPGKGKLIAQKDIADATFASGALGPCFGMKPSSNTIKAPISGIVTMVSSTKHAIAIKTDDDSQVMVHIGIDSVKLNGKGIRIFVKEGQAIKVGSELAKYDKMLFDKEGIDDTVVTILVNEGESEPEPVSNGANTPLFA